MYEGASTRRQGATIVVAIVVGAGTIVALYDAQAPVRLDLGAGIPIYCLVSTTAPRGPGESFGHASAGASILVQQSGAPPDFFDLGNPTNESASGLVCYRFSVTVAAPGLIVANTGFEVTSGLDGSVSGVLAIFFGETDGGVIATESLATHSWDNGSLTLDSTDDSLFVLSSDPLTGDQLVANDSVGLAGSLGSTPLTDWTGVSEGWVFA